MCEIASSKLNFCSNSQFTVLCLEVHVSPREKFVSRTELISTFPGISTYKPTANIKGKNENVHTSDNICNLTDKYIVSKGK